MHGSISIHPRGFGFVTEVHERAGEQPPVAAFVVPPDLNAFLADDIVTYRVEQNGDKLTARDLVLVTRPRTRLFGAVVRRGAGVFVRVDRAVSNTDWLLIGAADIATDALVSAVIDGGTVNQLCAPQVFVGTAADIERLLCRHDLQAEHSPEVEAAAAAAVMPTALGRRDLRGHVTVTIDGPSTKDIDDALLAFSPDDGGGVRVIVAIADVASVVGLNTTLDMDARSRGTSIYLAGRTLPMLPRLLSESLLSLNPDEDRAARTVELRIDPEGVVTSCDIHEAMVRSTARLTYDDVARFLDDNDLAAVPAATHDTLRLLRTAFARLSQARAQRGGKDVERAEIYLPLDSAGEPTALTVRSSNVAHVMVERLMVAANEAVAGYLVERGLAGVYRVHDAPTLQRTRALMDAAAALGVVAGFARDAPLSPRGLAAFDRQFKDTTHAASVDSLLMRLLGPARYTTQPSMHFGLAAPLYLHFTSPIRRYADLLVHRILRRYLRGERAAADSVVGIERICRDINDKARRAARAEAERERVLVARLYGKRIGAVVPGVVVGDKPQGALVQIDGALAVCVGLRSALGTRFDVEITAVDEDLGRIDVRAR